MSAQTKQPEALARAVALTFMGTRADKWPPEKLAEMAVFFSYVGYKKTREWKEEIVYFDSQKYLTDGPKTAVLPGRLDVELPPGKDPREVFADWLIAPKNPYFAQAIVNRVWSWLLGRGIIHEPDDIRPDNPPSNPKLLEILEQELFAAKYDLKELFRLILNSKTYQLSSIPQIGPSGCRRSTSPIIRCAGWMPKCWSMRCVRSPVRPRSIRAPFPSRSRSFRRTSVRLRWPTAASPARSWRCLGVRRGTRDWSPNAASDPRPPSACTCSTPATSSARSSRARSCVS